MYDYYDELGIGRETLLAQIKSQMSEKRFNHVLSVEKEAIRLAEIHGVDPQQAGLAGLLHDYAKELPDEEFQHLIKKYDLDRDLLNWGNNVWHGLVGIYKIREDFNLEDQEILQAIKVHTVGSSNMSKLDKVVYVADYTEETRNFPGVDEARKLADSDLNRAVAYESKSTIRHLCEKNVRIYPQALDTYNAFIQYI